MTTSVGSKPSGATRPWIGCSNTMHQVSTITPAPVPVLPLRNGTAPSLPFGPRVLPWVLRPRWHRYRVRCDVRAKIGGKCASQGRPGGAVVDRSQADMASAGVEPVDFLTKWDMFFDARFDDGKHPIGFPPPSL